METITVHVDGAVNVEALDETLRAALGAVVVGVSAADGAVIVHLRADAAPQAAAQARSVIVRHDPDTLSQRQQAEHARKDRLAAARRDAQDSAPDPDILADPQVRALAQRVAWLALEIEALRARVGEA